MIASRIIKMVKKNFTKVVTTIKINQYAKKIKSKRVLFRFWDTSSKVITKTVIIIIPNKQGRACTWREGCASCAKRKCVPAGGSEPFLNGMMKRLYCYIQEAILEEQFGKLTKKEQKKVPPICLICMVMVISQYLNLFKVMDLHWEGEGNPLVAAFRTNCIQG